MESQCVSVFWFLVLSRPVFPIEISQIVAVMFLFDDDTEFGYRHNPMYLDFDKATVILVILIILTSYIFSYCRRHSYLSVSVVPVNLIGLFINWVNIVIPIVLKWLSWPL